MVPLNGNVSSINLGGTRVANYTFTLAFVQDGTGGRTLPYSCSSWTPTIDCLGGIPPTINPAPNSTTYVTFIDDWNDYPPDRNLVASYIGAPMHDGRRNVLRSDITTHLRLCPLLCSYMDRNRNSYRADRSKQHNDNRHAIKLYWHRYGASQSYCARVNKNPREGNMKRILGVFWVLASGVVWAQISYPYILNPPTVAPSGACAGPQIQVLGSNGAIYSCNNGTWGIVSRGGGGCRTLKLQHSMRFQGEQHQRIRNSGQFCFV